MRIVVQKYGGSSLSTTQKILNLAESIARRGQDSEKLVLVVSAMGNTTDQLVQLARDISPSPLAREMDMLLASGEQVSVALMAMALHRYGLDAISFTGAQVGIRTRGPHTKARVIDVETERVMREIRNNRVVIVAGFQGVSPDADVTTLGRGGSDISAAALAVALKASRFEKYTDRDGVYGADPRIHPGARRIPHISYEEMLEMSHTGAKILHPRAVFFAWKYGLPILVRESLGSGEGTLIDKGEDRMEDATVSGVTHDSSVAKVSVYNVPDRPGMAMRVFKALSDLDIHVDMIVQSTTEREVNDISFTVAASDLDATVGVLDALRDGMPGMTVKASSRVSRVSLIGLGVRTNAHVVTEMFQALSDEGINIQMIGTSDVRISCIIDRDQVERAVRAIATRFDL